MGCLLYKGFPQTSAKAARCYRIIGLKTRFDHNSRFGKNLNFQGQQIRIYQTYTWICNLSKANTPKTKYTPAFRFSKFRRSWIDFNWPAILNSQFLVNICIPFRESKFWIYYSAWGDYPRLYYESPLGKMKFRKPDGTQYKTKVLLWLIRSYINSTGLFFYIFTFSYSLVRHLQRASRSPVVSVKKL